jgi:hypothetical protein
MITRMLLAKSPQRAASHHPKWVSLPHTQDGTFGPLFARPQKGRPKVQGLAAQAVCGQARDGRRRHSPID